MSLHALTSDEHFSHPVEVSSGRCTVSSSPSSEIVPHIVEAIHTPLGALISVGVESLEASPMLTSEQIDRGQFGATFHPVSGECLAGATFNEGKGVFFVEHRDVGWGMHKVTAIELSRIGDGKEHTEMDFPLAHWVFHWRTRMPIQK
ncbi:MAG: hypothetical protein Greene041662_636 [Candidatus Peregrinibacteria bacterium Greene0416_62]|nr:MAG: hypothetical protein Greene041662_636 [Candidatus Peregrinibacteria bacterium Greene0416_62]TSC97217.1 MAG: hypothetical protein Greene101449_1262 [Candidatus Peregrinibacteria bacterium Greene1014_49]